MDTSTTILVVVLVIAGLIIICKLLNSGVDGLILGVGSGSTLVISNKLQDASRFVEDATTTSTPVDTVSKLTEASNRLQYAIDEISKSNDSSLADLKTQLQTAKKQLDEMINQIKALPNVENNSSLQGIQRGGLKDFQTVLSKLYEKLHGGPSTPATVAVTTSAPPVTYYVEPQPTYYVQPIYVPPRPIRPPFPPRPFPPRPPGPFPPRPPGPPGPFPPGPPPGPPSPGSGFRYGV